MYIVFDLEFRSKKAFHSIFINILTARIVCIHCQLEILDLDQYRRLNLGLGVPKRVETVLTPSPCD